MLGAQMIHKLKNQDKNNAAPEPKEEKSALEVRIELKHETKAEAQIVECSICLEALPIDGSNAKRLNCSHMFHGPLLLPSTAFANSSCSTDDCVTKWLKTRDFCPNCKQPVAAE